MDYIEISGYKSIEKIRVDLQPINLFIGANGSGKSNFISFFEFLNRLYNRNLNEYISLKGGENKVLYRGKKHTQQISFKTEFENGRNGYSATLRLGTEGFVFTDERLIYKGDRGTDISYSDKEARIKNTDNYRAEYIIKFLDGFRKYHFHDTTDNSPFTDLCHIENDI